MKITKANQYICDLRRTTRRSKFGSRRNHWFLEEIQGFLEEQLEEEVKEFLLKMEQYLRVLKMTSPNWLGHIQLQQERRQKGEGRIRCYDFGISYL